MAHTGNAAPLNPEHMLQEIRSSVQARDAIKVRLVLDHLGGVERKVQHLLVYELLRADAEFTIPQLNRLVTSYPELSATLPVIRETLISQLIAHPDLLLCQLRNPSITDRRVLIQLAGELRLEAAVPALIGVLGETDERETIGSVLAALGAIGGPQVLNTLTEHLYSSDRELTTQAIHALHQLRTPEAMTWLAERMGTDNELDLLILGIFAEVQDDISLEKLTDALRSPHTKMRVFAKEQLVRIGARAVPILLANLSDTNADFVIHTLNVLGAIGDAQAVTPIRRLLSAEPPDANVRFAAYEALAQLPLAKGAFALAAGLTDPEDHVCVAAARAIDRNLNDVLVAGVRNLVRSESDEARHIAKIIVHAQVEDLFLSLVGDDTFQRLALRCLPHTHPDVREFHARLLQRHGYDEFAARAADCHTAGTAQQRLRVCAVDDSRVVLNIYRATLHELGFEPVLFEFPASALEWLQDEKPALVLTDLNMPVMSGLELASRIRQRYSAAELPVVLVTTQSDVQAGEAVAEAGINEVLGKPFDAPALQAVLHRHLGLCPVG